MNYFIFKNIDSRDIEGLIVQELPPISKPAKRVNKIEIEGRNGDVLEEEGYQSYDKTISIGLTKGYDINKIIGFLDGSGNLTLSNEPDKYYNATIIEQIDFERLVRFKTAKVKFHIQPFKYKTDEDYELIKDRKDKQAEGQNITLNDSSDASCEIEVMGNSEQETVPNEYDVLEYIESTGGQYINTNYYPNPNTKVEVDCQFTDAETTQQKMFRVEATDSFIFGMYINSGNYWAYVAADSTNWKSTGITADTKKHKFILDSYNSLVKIDNAFTQTITDTRTKTSSVPLSIFTASYLNGSGNIGFAGTPIAKMKLYSFKIYEKDVLLRHFVSAKRKSDNVIGLYEIMNDVFYTNQGTGTFTAGTVSGAPNLDNEIEVKSCKDNINLVVCNKNLIDLSKISSKTLNGITATYNEEKQTLTLNGTCTTDNTRFIISDTANIPIIKNKTSIVLKYLSGQATGYVASRCANSNWNYVFNYNLTTLNTDTNLISSVYSGNYTDITHIDFRIDKGAVLNNFIIQMMLTNDADTDYVEHQEQTFKIPLQQPFRKVGNYADTFVKQNVKWYEKHIIKRLILDGNETWHKSSNNLNVSYWAYNGDANYNTISQQSSNNIAKIKSNYFKATSYNGIFTNTEAITLNYLSSNLQRELRLGFGLNTNLTTEALLKSWLKQKYDAGTPVYLDYILETPVLIECTAAQTAILNELEYAHTYSNITHIYSTDEIEANAKVIYLAEITELAENEGNTKSEPVLLLEKTRYNKVELAINDVRFKYDFQNDSYVEIDCEEKTITYDGLNRNRQITIDYDFPKLEIGNNRIEFYSGDCIVKMKRKDRWL